MPAPERGSVTGLDEMTPKGACPAFFETMDDGKKKLIVIQDAMIVWMSLRAALIFGNRVGQAGFDMVADASRGAVMGGRLLALHGKPWPLGSRRYIGKDGRVIRCQARGEPIIWRGELASLVHVFIPQRALRLIPPPPPPPQRSSPGALLMRHK